MAFINICMVIQIPGALARLQFQFNDIIIISGDFLETQFYLVAPNFIYTSWCSAPPYVTTPAIGLWQELLLNSIHTEFTAFHLVPGIPGNSCIHTLNGAALRSYQSSRFALTWIPLSRQINLYKFIILIPYAAASSPQFLISLKVILRSPSRFDRFFKNKAIPILKNHHL